MSIDSSNENENDKHNGLGASTSNTGIPPTASADTANNVSATITEAHIMSHEEFEDWITEQFRTHCGGGDEGKRSGGSPGHGTTEGRNQVKNNERPSGSSLLDQYPHIIREIPRCITNWRKR